MGASSLVDQEEYIAILNCVKLHKFVIPFLWNGIEGVNSFCSL